MPTRKIPFHGETLSVSLYDSITKSEKADYRYSTASCKFKGKIQTARAQTSKQAIEKLTAKLENLLALTNQQESDERFQRQVDKMGTWVESAADRLLTADKMLHDEITLKREQAKGETFLFWCEKMIQHKAEMGKSESYVTSLRNYKDYVAQDAFGQKLLSEITPIDVETLIKTARDRPYLKGKRLVQHHSGQYAKLFRQFISVTFSFARNSGVKGLDIPLNRDNAVKDVVHAPKVSLTLKQIHVLLNSCASLQDKLMIGLGLSAIRPSEYCGLTLADVDLERGVLLISKQIKYRSRGEGLGRFKDTESKLKTRQAKREVPILNFLRPLLEERLKDDSSVYVLHRGKSSLDGTYCSKRIPTLVSAAQATEEGKDLPSLKTYFLKHTGISLMHESGMSLADISAISGVSATTLLKHYVLPAPLEGRQERMNQALKI